MKQPKKNYSAPSADLLVVRFEQNIALSYGVQNEAGATISEDDDYTYDY